MRSFFHLKFVWTAASGGFTAKIDFETHYTNFKCKFGAKNSLWDLASSLSELTSKDENDFDFNCIGGMLYGECE